jgi:hypothetical protein
LEQSQRLVLRPELKLRAHLDETFGKPFALMPSDLDLAEDEAKKAYSQENNIFGLKTSHYLVEELVLLEQTITRRKMRRQRLIQCGTGRDGHDLHYIPQAWTGYNLQVVLVDGSPIVHTRIQARLPKLLFGHSAKVPAPRVVLADVQKLVATQPPPLVTYAGRLIQTWSAEQLISVLIGWGNWLRRPNSRLVLVHPFAEDNPSIQWSRTVPYPLELILRALKKGAGSRVWVSRTKKFGYYNQVYTALTLQAT